MDEDEEVGTDAGAKTLGDVMKSENLDQKAKPETDADGMKPTEKKDAQQDGVPAWMSQLPEEMRGNESLKSFQKIGDLAKSYAELKAKEAVIPDSAEKYSIKGDGADTMKEMAFKAKLTDEQAKAIYENIMSINKKDVETRKAEAEKQFNETDEALKKEYGSKYAEKMGLLERGIKAYGGDAVGAKLKESGLLFDSDFIHMFIELGEQAAEAGLFNHGDGGSKKDYTTTSDGGTFKFNFDSGA